MANGPCLRAGLVYYFSRRPSRALNDMLNDRADIIRPAQRPQIASA